MHIDQEKSVVTLANATALATTIMLNVAGTEVGSTINGTPVGRQLFDQFFISHITNRLPQLRPTADVH